MRILYNTGLYLNNMQTCKNNSTDIGKKEENMSQDFFWMIQDIQSEEIEMKLILECAPLLSGLRAANLINIERKQFRNLKTILKNTDISYYVLFNGGEKYTILLYRYRGMVRYLSRPETRKLLKRMGYDSTEIYELLYMFSIKYKNFVNGMDKFPHEMGVFLGYPIEDVEGFIENDGKNFLCTGYWKVYKDAPAKTKLFQSFEQAKETMITLMFYGFNIIEVVDIFNQRRNIDAIA